jgi:tetratricopeptide (TPR) repeat protein
MDNEIKSQMGFAQRRLPWVVVAGALVVYLATLVTWGTVAGLPTLSKVAGWEWRPPFYAPLHFLLTYPVRWLPETWQLAGLNALAAVWSALALGLLARCVAILPHDRTKHQRQLERSDYSFLSIPTAWVPPLFAVLVCGLQLSFWENAIVGTGEALDLLLFAFIVWNLLEYRIEEKNWRLALSAFVYGLGMTNNFAMIAFLPAFLVAVIWVKGYSFFNWSFLFRSAGAGLAGLCFYLLLPALINGSNLTHLDFWGILLVNLGYQKDNLISFPRYIILIIGLTSIAPVLFMGIRWPAQFGDANPAGAKLTELMTHLIHGVFLLSCVYVAFDPPFSPRRLSGNLAFLPFYFLGALSVGYFVGYFLLICGAKPVKSWERPSPIVRGLYRLILVAIWVALPAVPIALAVINYPKLSLKNGKELKYFGEAAAASLPDGPAYVLCDDKLRLLALHAALSQVRPNHSLVLIDTTAMPLSGYHRFQHALYGDRWPDTLATRPLLQGIKDPVVLGFVMGLARLAPLYYLHPSFGYYFERFYGQPHKLVTEMHLLPTNSLRAPLLTAEQIRVTDEFLSRYYRETLPPVIGEVARNSNPKTANRVTLYGGQIEAMVYNDFGTELQKANRLDQAGEYFQRALALDPANPTAYINLDFNRYLHHPTGNLPGPSAGATNRLAPYGGNWNRILSANGPVDEPNSCMLLAQSFLRGNNFVQAAQQLLRSLELNPGFFPAELMLAGDYVQLNRGGDALHILDAIRKRVNVSDLPLEIQFKIMEAEAWAHAGLGEMQTAVQILHTFQEKYPKQDPPYNVLAKLYLNRRQSTNAVAVYREQLKAQPENVNARINLSAVLIQNLGDYQGAIQQLDEALTLDPKNQGALMNRAIANLNLRNLKEARDDYLSLQGLASQPIPSVLYGLGEVAWLEKNYQEALKYYREYLKKAPAGAPETKNVKERISIIESGKV